MRLGVAAAYVDGRFLLGDIDVEDGRVRAVGVGAGSGSRLALPGFVDLQVNGVDGVDFLGADAADYRLAAHQLAATGVTAFQPTFVTGDPEEVLDALGRLASVDCEGRVLGAHLEGPFLSPRQLGAHDGRWRRDPDAELMKRFLAAGPVRHVTLAPELPGSLELVDLLVERGVTVALGHSDADAEAAHAAFDHGARVVTHLFNAMSLGSHRAPGLAMAALARDDVHVTVVLDGHHLSDEAAKLAWAVAEGRFALVSDRVATGGLGGRRVDLSDEVPRTPEGTIAGGSVNMSGCLRRLCDLGASLEASVAAATEVPARIARRPDVGRIRVSGPADVVVVDEDLAVHSTLVGGRGVA